MAREISEIYNAIVLEKQTMAQLNALQPQIDDAQTLLQDVSSTSNVAVWRLYAWIIAVAIWMHETLWDTFSLELDIKASQLVTGTKEWYRKQCFLFQNGDSLQFINGRYDYASVNPVLQIIKRAAVIEVGGQVRLKVAKLSGTTPIPLTNAEKVSFGAYINKIKFAGTNISIISALSDQLIVAYKIYFDALVLTPSGESIINTGVFPVEDAIVNYIKNLPFDGVLNLTGLTDEIQKVAGVVDPVLINAQARYGSLPYQNIIDSYNANAGYIIIDPTSPLSGTLNYIQNV